MCIVSIKISFRTMLLLLCLLSKPFVVLYREHNIFIRIGDLLRCCEEDLLLSDILLLIELNIFELDLEEYIILKLEKKNLKNISNDNNTLILIKQLLLKMYPLWLLKYICKIYKFIKNEKINLLSLLHNIVHTDIRKTRKI